MKYRRGSKVLIWFLLIFLFFESIFFFLFRLIIIWGLDFRFCFGVFGDLKSLRFIDSDDRTILKGGFRIGLRMNEKLLSVSFELVIIIINKEDFVYSGDD